MTVLASTQVYFMAAIVELAFFGAFVKIPVIAVKNNRQLLLA